MRLLYMAVAGAALLCGAFTYPFSLNISSGGPPGGAVTHGSQLILNKVGPWAVQGVAQGHEQLTSLDPSNERLSGWWPKPSYVPNAPYVYNGNPNNHGGIVPAGGMIIDGYSIPGGTWVIQNYNMTDSVIFEGVCGCTGSQCAITFPPAVVFRANRMRGNWSAPGWINQNTCNPQSTAWFLYNDMGGISSVPPNIDEIPITFNDASTGNAYIIRNYLSVATTLAFIGMNGAAAVENYGECLQNYYPTNNTTYHLNGIANHGGETATLWLRNHLDFSPQCNAPGSTYVPPYLPPGDNPNYQWQNDVIQMAADSGAYPGTGTNLDGSHGYQIRDNYLAGANYTLQLGVDKSNTPAMVSNVVVTGNIFSTKWFQNSGATGISYKNPSWGVQGNLFSNNTWGDDYGSGSWTSGGGDPPFGETTRQYPTGNGPRTGQPITCGGGGGGTC